MDPFENLSFTNHRTAGNNQIIQPSIDLTLTYISACMFRAPSAADLLVQGEELRNGDAYAWFKLHDFLFLREEGTCFLLQTCFFLDSSFFLANLLTHNVLCDTNRPTAPKISVSGLIYKDLPAVVQLAFTHDN